MYKACRNRFAAIKEAKMKIYGMNLKLASVWSCWHNYSLLVESGSGKNSFEWHCRRIKGHKSIHVLTQ